MRNNKIQIGNITGTGDKVALFWRYVVDIIHELRWVS